MRGLRRRIAVLEVVLAIRLAAFGEWWAFCATGRIRELSRNIRRFRDDENAGVSLHAQGEQPERKRTPA